MIKDKKLKQELEKVIEKGYILNCKKCPKALKGVCRLALTTEITNKEKSLLRSVYRECESDGDGYFTTFYNVGYGTPLYSWAQKAPDICATAKMAYLTSMIQKRKELQIV